MSTATYAVHRPQQGLTQRSAVPTLRALPIPVAEPLPLRADRPRSRRLPRSQGAFALPFAVARQHEAEADREFGPRSTPSRELPDPQEACSALVQAVIEVLAGSRPASQLVRWLSSDVHAAVTRRAALAARMGREDGPGRPAVVRRVRVCEPADGVVEASAVVVVQGRVRAVAVRLEGLDGRWRATAVEMG